MTTPTLTSTLTSMLTSMTASAFSAPAMRTRLAVLAVLAAAGVTACSDAPSAPSAPSAALAPAARAAQNVTTVGDTTVTVFTYLPGSGVERTFANVHKLWLPAGAVCDPLTSGYGVGTWDSACLPAALPIVFTAKSWTDRATGRPHIRFSPDVRFVPGKTVELRLKDLQAAAQSVGTLAWCPTGSTTCVDEAATDPTLVTRYEPKQGFVWRRLKHFSGYTVVVDRSGNEFDGGY